MKQSSAPFVLIKSLSTEADIHYLCGTQPPETAIFIKKKGSSIFIVSEMEFNRFCRFVPKGIQVVHPEKIGSSWKKGPVDWILKCVNEKKISVSSDFPLGVAEELKKAGFKIKIDKLLPCPNREVKKPVEIEHIKRSQKAAVAAMKAALKQIASSKIEKDGMLTIRQKKLTSENVRATSSHTLLDHGCFAEETIVACGPDSADPHERGEGPLVAGQPIVIDIFPRSGKTGYWGDITRTVCRGPAPTELKKQYNAVKVAQAAQLKKCKAGVFTDTIHQIGSDVMSAHGYKTERVNDIPQGFIHGTGHGVGLEIHEAPRISSANHQKLRAGHVITIEPGLYYPKIGGVRIEDTILITQDGYKMLAPCPKRLEI